MIPVLTEFARTGSLGPIHIRLSGDELLAVLGQPDAWSVGTQPRIAKYGDLELTFDGGILTGIQVEFWQDRPTLPFPLWHEDAVLAHRCHPAELLKHLARNEIGVRVDGQSTDRWLGLRTVSGNVRLVIDEEGCLTSMAVGFGGSRTDYATDVRWWSSEIGWCRVTARSPGIRSAVLVERGGQIWGRGISAAVNGLLIEEGPVVSAESSGTADEIGALLLPVLAGSRRAVAPGTFHIEVDRQGRAIDAIQHAAGIHPAKRFAVHATVLLVEEHPGPSFSVVPMQLTGAPGEPSWELGMSAQSLIAPSIATLGEAVMSVFRHAPQGDE